MSYFRAALEMVWSESGEKTDAMMAITPDNLKCRLALAGFLLSEIAAVGFCRRFPANRP